MENGRKEGLGEVETALSVVVCTLGGDGARDAVESVVASAERAGRHVEVVVVWQSACTVPHLGPHARVLRVIPAGLANARNRGVAVSGAPLVAFVDDDEVVDPGWVRAVITAFEDDVAAVFGPIAPRDDRGLPYCRYDGNGTARVFRGRHIPPWTVGTGGNMAFRRKPLLEVGGFDVLFGAGAIARSAEDTEVILRLLRAGHSLAWIPEMVAYHPTKTASERLASRFPYAYGMGKVMRRHRDPLLAARYVRTIGEAAARAAVAGDRRRLREAAETMRGFAAGVGFRAAPQSPEWLLRQAPASVRDAVDGAPLEPREPTFRPDPHLIYFVGVDRVLHVYANPTARLRGGLAARECIRADAPVGIPQLLALDETDDALWVVEERLHGRPPRRRSPKSWFGAVAGWAAQLATRSPVQAHDTFWWQENAEAVITAAPTSLRAPIEAAFHVVGESPAHPVHGDLQPKNILLGPDGVVGVIDWERAYDAGPPGLDLLFLAVMARGEPPSADVISLLADSRDPDWAPLRSLLAIAGLAEADLPSHLLAALASWAYDEEVRLSAPGMPRVSRAYRQLLLEFGPRLS